MPEDWVAFENGQLSQGWETGALEQIFADGCLIMHGSRYAEWKPFNYTEVHRGDAFGVPRGLLILEAQTQLMEFLSSMTALILGREDYMAHLMPASDGDTRKCNKWDQLVSAGPKTGAIELWLSVGTIHACQPYSKPRQFDIDAIVAIATNQAEAAQDELWLLQTEPAYFLEKALFFEKNWIDTIPGAEDWSRKTKFSDMAMHLTYYHFHNAREWQWLLEECQNAKHEYVALRDKIHVGERLPPTYERALGCLDASLLNSLRTGSRFDLRRVLATVPSFQEYWEMTENLGDATRIVMEMKKGVNLKYMHEKDRLLWCICVLSMEPDDQFPWDIAFVLQQLDDHLARSSRAEAARIGPIAHGYVSEVAAIHQILSNLRLHRPFYPTVSLSDAKNEDRLLWRFMIKMPGEDELHRDPVKCGQAIQPLSRFRMPKGRRDKAWLSSADGARKELVKVWEAFREDYTGIIRASGIIQADIERYRKMLSQYESPEQLALLAAERERILNLPSKRITTQTEASLASSRLLQDSSQPKKFDMEVPRIKIKTRPQVSSPLDEVSHDLVDNRQSQTAVGILPTIYAIKGRSVRVATLIFPGSTEDKGTIDWLDFVSLMLEVGFVAEHRGGSAFTFKGNQGSINVHRPHPNTEMGPAFLRATGKRFSRRFGWERETFEEAD